MSNEEDCGEKETDERLGRGTELLWDPQGSPTGQSWGERTSQPDQSTVPEGEEDERGWRSRKGETPGRGGVQISFHNGACWLRIKRNPNSVYKVFWRFARVPKAAVGLPIIIMSEKKTFLCEKGHGVGHKQSMSSLWVGKVLMERGNQNGAQQVLRWSTYCVLMLHMYFFTFIPHGNPPQVGCCYLRFVGDETEGREN